MCRHSQLKHVILGIFALMLKLLMHKPFVEYRITELRQCHKGLYIIIVKYWYLTKSIANREKEGKEPHLLVNRRISLTHPLVGLEPGLCHSSGRITCYHSQLLRRNTLS
jgi:hypothetical protein